MFVPAIAHGQEISEDQLKVQPMSKGQVSKFDGLLFSIPLVVKMKIEKDYLEKKFQEEIRYETAKVITEWKANLDKSIIEHEAVISKLQVEKTLLNEQMDFCHKTLEKQMIKGEAWYESGPFLFSVGLVVGIVASVGIFYIAN